MDHRNGIDSRRVLGIEAFPEQCKRIPGIRKRNSIFSEFQRSDLRVTCKVAVGNKTDSFTDTSDCFSHFSMTFAICTGHSGILIDVVMTGNTLDHGTLWFHLTDGFRH